MAKEPEAPKTNPTAADIAALDPKARPPAKVATEAELAVMAKEAPRDDRLRATEGIVARGHTVVNEDGTHSPGMKVTATKEEIERMRRRGVLVDPHRIIAPLGTGPRFYKEDEASKGDPL